MGQTLAVVLAEEGFAPSCADEQVWMRRNWKFNLWEYICVFVDDLALALEDPKSFLDKLRLARDKGGYGYKLKGDGPIEFHLGCDYCHLPVQMLHPKDE